MKILLISDKPNWAYANIANSLIKFNDKPNLKFDHLSIKSDLNDIKKNNKKYDLIFVIGWQNWIDCLDQKRTIVGIHSHQSFDNGKSTPDKDVLPSKNIIKHLSKFVSINTVSKRLQKVFLDSGLETVYTPNGVDSKMFLPINRDEHRFVVGCVASAKNEWNKSVNSIIRKSCEISGVKISTAMLESKINHNKMPSFYQSIDCYVCASKSEGMSLSVLEAASTGSIIVSTNCGDIGLLVQDPKNGFIIDRNIDALTLKIKYLLKNKEQRLEMHKNIRKDIEDIWCWSKRIKVWTDFIESSIKLL